MNSALHALVGLACPVAAYQFYLQVVQRVYVGEAVADGALQGRVACQQMLLTGDECQGVDSAMPFGFYRALNFFAQFGVRYQF